MDEIKKLQNEIVSLRDTNRRLNRRIQIAEAAQQSAVDYLSGWLKVFSPERSDRKRERRYILYILRDLERRTIKLSSRKFENEACI